MKLILTDDEGTVIDLWATPDDACELSCFAETLPEQSPTRKLIETACEAVDNMDIPDTAISSGKGGA